MKYRLMDVLKCPNCFSELSIIPFVINEIENNNILFDKEKHCDTRCAWMEEQSENDSNCVKCMSMDIELGIILCNNDHFFPIIRSIPRLFENSINLFYNDIKPYLNNLSIELKQLIKISILQYDENFENKFLHTQKSFTSEWKFVGNNERAWGRSTEQRKNLFLDSFNIEDKDIIGKKLNRNVSTLQSIYWKYFI